MRRFTWVALLIVGTALIALAVASVFTTVDAQGPDGREPDTITNNNDDLLLQARALFDTIPDTMPGSASDTPEMVSLGEKLYFETAVSIKRNQSCNSCHLIDAERGGTVYTETAEGSKGEFGSRNAPTVLNAGFQVDQFWDGRADTLEEQAMGPPLNPIEMGMPDEAAFVERLREAGYEDAFAKAFPDSESPLTFENAAVAIAAFERTLITHDRFDEYLMGNEAALSDNEKKGLQLFIDLGCAECHNGPVMGGVTYRQIGLFHEYPYTDDRDLGLYEVTENEADKLVFKVPMLRNVLLTAPYFHDGKVGTVAEAIDLMAYLQLDKKLVREDIHNLLRFLNSLTDIERAQSTPPQIQADATGWNPPSPDAIPEGEEGDLIRYGLEILSNTASTIGPYAEDPEMRYSGNLLACSNCHQVNGTKQFGMSWVGVLYRYPTFRGRSGAIGNIEDRVNGCMQRSMAGQPLPEDSREMQAIVAYFEFLTEDMPRNVTGVKMPGLDQIPDRAVDLAAGELSYNIYCRACHGADGEGYRSILSQEEGNDPTAPALWGESSFNNGAGMHRVLTAAPFIWINMPLGTQWDNPVISQAEAYDVAGYFNSFPRPEKPNLEEDYPNLMLKPVDSPYPPYADPFSQEQHQFGPFQPIMDWYEAHPLPASVTVNDQPLDGNSVTVAAVKAAGPGWLVIHAVDDEDKPGEVLGYTAVSEGEHNDISVEIDPAQATQVLFAMLHEDTGTEGEFEFPEADPPYNMDGAQVVRAFSILSE